MASYYDEHNCEPLANGQGPDHMMHFARLLFDTGVWHDEEFSSLFSDRTPPPTSKGFLEKLEKKMVRDEGFQCPVCLKDVEQDDVYLELPCKHRFHEDCIMPWLKKTSTCPLCRHQLPTDDEEFEAMLKFKKREKQRKHEIETLHDSMFG